MAARLRAPRPARQAAGRAPLRRGQRGVAARAQEVGSSTAVTSRMVDVQGAQLELLSAQPSGGATAGAPPIVFLHGAAHGAWCWAEHVLPWLAKQGCECHALSWRGHVCDGQCSLNEVIVQGASSRHAGAAAGDAAGTLASHAADLGAFLEQVATRPPLLVGHSFGGLILQRYALDSANAAGAEGMPTSAGLAFLASNNPEGTDFGRFLRKAPIMTIKVTWSFISKNFLQSTDALRDVFFCDETPRAELERLRETFNAQATDMRLLDLKVLRTQELPLPRLDAERAPPALVLGGDKDTVVDADDCRILASYYGTEAKVLRGSGHDVMLDGKWREYAAELLAFAKTL